MHYLNKAEDAIGDPAMDFEKWYQQGMACFNVNLPKFLRKQALNALVARWMADGHQVAFWMLRAFAYGAAGQDVCGTRTPWLSSYFRWPTPPDAAWKVVVFCYPGGECDLDMLHPVSRKFWSEDNGFFHPPENLTRSWYEKMGFEVITVIPEASVELGAPNWHLKLI